MIDWLMYKLEDSVFSSGVRAEQRTAIMQHLRAANQLDERVVPVLRSEVQRGAPVVQLLRHVGPVLQQGRRRLFVPVARRLDQRVNQEVLIRR